MEAESTSPKAGASVPGDTPGKRRLRVNFAGKEWDHANLDRPPYPFGEFLTRHYELELSASPEYLMVKESRDFFATYLTRFADAPVTIFFAGEAIAPDFNLFDYAIGFDHLDYGDRYFRLHTVNFFSFEMKYGSLDKTPEGVDRAWQQKTGFCNFIYSNARAHRAREEIFHKLCGYKRVDAAGKLLNNFGDAIRKATDWREEKVRFQAGYKFSVAFENALYPGYTTEKLLNPMFAMSIPIYWGNPRVGEYFNSRAFVNCHDYASFDEVVERVREIDNDDTLYREMLAEPWMTPEQQAVARENADAFERFLTNIFEQDPHTARRRGRGTWTWAYMETMRERIAALHRRDRLRSLTRFFRNKRK